MSSKVTIPVSRFLIMLIVSLVVLVAGSPVFAHTYWVSPGGTDGAGYGTSAGTPWKTIDYARTQIAHPSPMTHDIIVNILPGEYPVGTPITFAAADSGSTNGYYIIYRSVDTNGVASPGTAELVGSADLNGWLHAAGGNIWSNKIGTGKTVVAIYENGELGRSARSPNYVFSDRYPMAQAPYYSSVTGGGPVVVGVITNDWLQYGPTNVLSSLVPADITLPSKVNWWGPGGYCDWSLISCRLYTNRLSAPVPSDHIAFASYPDHPAAASPSDRYFVSGIKKFLDAPGEFYYSTTASGSDAGWLYYYPRCSDPNASDVDIRVPTNSATLISVTGTSVDAHAHHIKFEGLGLAYANYAFDAAAFDFEKTDHIEVRDCHIKHVGGGAIRMHNNNVSNLVYGCWIEHCGVAGIAVINDLLRDATPTGPNAYHIISNCKIHDIGEVQCNAARTAGVALWNASDCEVSYCDIYNSARYATTLRGHWKEYYVNYPDNGINIRDNGKYFAKNNTHKYIRMTDCMQDTGDGALMHACQCNGLDGTPGGGTNGSINSWANIVISGGYADPSMHDEQGIFGIYLDWPNSTLYQNLSNIWIKYISTNIITGVIREYRHNNNPVQTTYNVSWTNSDSLGNAFNTNLMDYVKIGLKPDFPVVYDDQSTVIADDHTLDYLESEPGWLDSNVNSYKGDVRFRSHNDSAWAKWVPDFPFTRKYEVSIWKTNVTSASANAKYTIYYPGGSVDKFVNQSNGPVGWVVVSTNTFATGRSEASGSVMLSANTSDDKAVRADAVRFTDVGLVNSGALGGEAGWWGFENNGNDNSGYVPAHNATCYAGYSSAVKTSGDYSAYFNGISSYFDVADDSHLDIGTGDFAVSLWFYRNNNITNNLRILSKGAASDTSPGYAIYGSDTVVSFALSNGDAAKPRRYLTGTHLGTNAWNHLAVNVSRTGYMTMYINGVKVAEQNISDWKDLTLDSSLNLNIGRNVSSGALYWPGYIDEVSVFQRVLSELEITVLSN